MFRRTVRARRGSDASDGAAVNVLKSLVIAAAAFLASPAVAQPAERWNSHIDEASARFGVPKEWIKRVMGAESSGRTVLAGRPITSRAGAMGLMQLMPGTWREMRAALRLGTDPHDPRDNVLAGTAYLRAMYNRFGFPGMFAAYNAGPARYATHLATGRRLPPETIAYVAKVAGTSRVHFAAPGREPQMAAVLVAMADPPQPRSEDAPPLAATDELFARLGTLSGASE